MMITLREVSDLYVMHRVQRLWLVASVGRWSV
jgi:hypothetical protein